MRGDTLSNERSRHVLILVAGGFLGTLLVTLVAQPVASFLGLPEFDFAKGLVRGFSEGSVVTYSASWWLGMVTHFLIGSVLFPLVFDALEQRYFPERTMGFGLGFGVGLWFLSQIILSPLADLGIFGRLTSDPALLGFVSFNAHVLYGITLGLTGSLLFSREHKDEVLFDTRQAA